MAYGTSMLANAWEYVSSRKKSRCMATVGINLLLDHNMMIAPTSDDSDVDIQTRKGNFFSLQVYGQSRIGIRVSLQVSSVSS